MRNKIVSGYLHDTTEEQFECENVDGIPCMIPQAKDLLSLDEQKSLHQCSTFYQYNCMLTRLMSSTKSANNIVKMCKTTSVYVDKEDYDGTSTVRYAQSLQYSIFKYLCLQFGMNVTTGMMIYLMDHKIESTREYLLYDFPAIVSAVGGNLGLFLGFSCFSTGKSIMDRYL